MRRLSDRHYPHYVLSVMMIVYVFNFIDRQILSILAEDIKADLGLTDSQIGFLYGTAFAVFYAVFGIPLGRLADNWDRRKLISLGLGFWSLMTALSGTARSLLSLGFYRIGVGIGEASATPAALSLLADYYSRKVRATVMALYSSGIYIGAGIGLFIGGLTVDQWESIWPDPATAPLGLRGWQIAYLVVGIPGILMALWVWTIREPKRGAGDGVETVVSEHPFRDAFTELLALLPVTAFWRMRQVGCSGKDQMINLMGLALIAAVVWLLIDWTGDLAQWLALGGGCYVTMGWVQINRMRDPVGFALMFRTKSYLFLLIAFSCVAFVSYGVGFWGPPFFQRVHGMSIAEAGSILGLSASIGGGLGVVAGGVLGDLCRMRTANGGLYVSIAAVLGALVCNLMVFTVPNLTVALVFNFFALMLAPMWIGIATSTVVNLVLPRLRALAVAIYILAVTFIGLALGPYGIGLVSRLLSDGGTAAGEALRLANLGANVMLVVGVLFLYLACRHLPEDEKNAVARARQLGEDI